MKIKCFFGKHKWEYGSEDVTLLTVSNAPYMNVVVSSTTRYCNRCNKKECLCNGETLDGSEHWVECQLNKEEQRDKKLKQLIG